MGRDLEMNKPPREIVPAAPTVNQQGAKGISLGGTNKHTHGTELHDELNKPARSLVCRAGELSQSSGAESTT